MGTSGVEHRGHALREIKSISSTHHRHHHRLLCHPPVGDHGPFGPGGGRGYSVMRSPTCSFDLATSPSAVPNPTAAPTGLFSHQGLPQLPLRLHFPELPSRSHAPLAESAAKYTSYTWPGTGGPS